MSNNKSIRVELQGLDSTKLRIGQLITAYGHMEPLFHQISGIMHHEVEENFQAGGRDPQWPESQRVKKHGGQTLIDKAQLVNSIQEFITASSAGVSTNKPYAAIHNFGGPITRHARSELFNRNRSKSGRFTKGTKAGRGFTIGSHTFNMPQREFMKISFQGVADIELAAARFVSG